MKTINKLISETEKGCGKIKIMSVGKGAITRAFCPYTNKYKKVYYCDECKAKLEILNQIKPIIEKVKEDLKHKVRYECYDEEEVLKAIDEILGNQSPELNQRRDSESLRGNLGEHVPTEEVRDNICLQEHQDAQNSKDKRIKLSITKEDFLLDEILGGINE